MIDTNFEIRKESGKIWEAKCLLDSSSFLSLNNFNYSVISFENYYHLTHEDYKNPMVKLRDKKEGDLFILNQLEEIICKLDVKHNYISTASCNVFEGNAFVIYYNYNDTIVLTNKEVKNLFYKFWDKRVQLPSYSETGDLGFNITHFLKFYKSPPNLEVYIETIVNN